MGRPERRIGNRHVTKGGTVGRITGLLVLVAAAFFLGTTILPGGMAYGAVERPEPGLTDTGPTINGMTVQQAGGRLAIVEMRGTSLPAPEILATDSDRLVLLFVDTVLPSGYWEKVYNIPLVKKVELSQEARGVKMTVHGNMRLHLENVLGEAPANRLQLHIASPSEETRERVTEEMDTHGGSKHDPMRITEPVSLELRDSDLRDVFRMLGAMMNMNVLVDPSVPPEPVTITLNEVPLNEAFRYLMRMYDVTYAVMGKTVIFGKEANLAKTLGTRRTKSFHIAYADLASVQGLIASINGVDSGSIIVDERLREMYVTASEAVLAEVERALDKVDHPGQQVMLQARVIEVSDEAKDEVGAIVNAVYNKWATSFSAAGGVIEYFDSNETDETLKALDVELNGLETDEKAKVLASPAVITIDGEEAEVKLTEDVVYKSGEDESGDPEFEVVEAGPVLKFRPLVGRANVVTIELDISASELLGWKQSGNAEVPLTRDRSVKTNVRVRNGEPFVVGGLISERTDRSVWKFPVISEIPLLGELFKIRSATTTNSEVVIIVVPYILDVPTEPVRASN